MKMNKKVIGLVLTGMMSLSVVGCGSYKVENKDAYNKGYYEYAVADGVDALNSEYKIQGVISLTVDEIQCDNVRDEEIVDFDGNYLFTIKQEDLDDYEWGVLQFAIDRTEEEKEKDLYYIFENGVGQLLEGTTDEHKKIIEKYNDSYVRCYDEMLDLLYELEDKYGKEDISYDYNYKIQEIIGRQYDILDAYTEEMAGVCATNMMQWLFNFK